MQVIIISPNNTTHKHWHLSPMKQLFIGLLALITLASLFFTGYQWIKTSSHTANQIPSLSQITTSHNGIIQQAQVQAYYAKRLGRLQAEAIRLTALTEKLADMSGLDPNSILLTVEQAQGGIELGGELPSGNDFEAGFHQIKNIFEHQSSQLMQLQGYLITEDNIKSAIPSGRPIKEGWVSSFYGKRIDPFNGKQTFHRGLDFAGKEGSQVVAVADGIVSWQGTRSSYGELIEIDHGNGYQTRYAHNKKLTVAIGDRIKKGQEIALMGSTGRSTGPHVHFEVLRDGKTVNPYNFVKN